ncbi:MAG: hypothetical protein WCP33_03675 [Deltaproteobacteria bacterium]
MAFNQPEFGLLDITVYVIEILKLEMDLGVVFFGAGLAGTARLHTAPSVQKQKNAS